MFVLDFYDLLLLVRLNGAIHFDSPPRIHGGGINHLPKIARRLLYYRHIDTALFGDDRRSYKQGYSALRILRTRWLIFFIVMVDGRALVYTEAPPFLTTISDFLTDVPPEAVSQRRRLLTRSSYLFYSET